MGKYNELLGIASRYNNFAGALVQDGEGVTTLSPEISTNIVLEDDRPENFLMQRTVLAAGGLLVAAAGAGIRSEVQLFNPVGSNLLVVMEYFTWRTTAPGTGMIMGFLQTQLATLNGTLKQNRDSRRTGARPTAEIRSKNAGGASAIAPTWTNYVASGQYGGRPYILRPGDSLVWQPDADNAACELFLQWYERALNPFELADRV